MSKQLHHGITFSQNYVVGPARHYFNVGTALYRLEALERDVGRTGVAIALASSKEDDPLSAWGAANSFEVVSYYAVAIVTCLEWHARSRLADLFSYTPTTLDAEDLKPLASTNLMQQMIANDVSAPQLVAGMRNVSSRSRYLDVFRRIYGALDIDAVPEAIVHSVQTGASGERGKARNGIEMLDVVFEYRNDLVHEIGPPVIGAWAQRDHLDPATALRWCHFAKRCMLALEQPITMNAPHDFPNLLDEHGRSATEVARLDRKVAELEKAVSDRVSHLGGHEDAWIAALEASRKAFEANEDFHGPALHVRLFPNTSDSDRALRLGRIAYLEAVLKGLEFFV